MKRLISRHVVEVLEGFFETWAKHPTRLETFLAGHLAPRKSIEYREKQTISENVTEVVRNWRLLCHLARSEQPRAVYERSCRPGLSTAREDKALAAHTRLSIDRELLEHLEASMGKEAAWHAVEEQCRPAALTGRVNAARITRSELLNIFIRKHGFSVRKCSRTSHGFAFISPPHVA